MHEDLERACGRSGYLTHDGDKHTMTAWRYSRRRLAEIEERLRNIDGRVGALDSGGRRAEEVRFANAADRDEYAELIKEMVLTTNERDRCAAAIWRRNRRRGKSS